MSLPGLARALLLAAAGAAMASCHHSFPLTGDPCADYSTAKCARLAECGLTALFELSDNTCAPRLALWCQANQGIPGSGWTKHTLEACAEEIGTLDCNILRASGVSQGEFGPACGQLMKGTLPQAAPCADSRSCETGTCLVSELGACGFCGIEENPVPHSGLGGTCIDAVQYCDLGLHCVKGTCQSPAQEGEACMFTNECDANQQLVCDPVSMRCARQVVEVKQIGEACDTWGVDVPPVKQAACAAGSTCQSGVCVATAPDGGSCAGYKPCMFPFVCDPEGVLCALPDRPTCQ